MKKQLSILLALLCFNLVTCVSSQSGGGQEADPYIEKMRQNGGDVFSGNSHGNQPLYKTPYGYEIWSAGGSNNRLIWYGPEYGGGAAFRAEWNNPNDFLGRVGYFWNTGRPYTYYKNVFCDFEFTRSRNGTAGNYSYLGIYGWSRDPMIEWYIVEDWYGDGIIGPSSMGGTVRKKGECIIDDEKYIIYEGTRPAGSGNIEGRSVAFQQYFSVRQKRRQSGTISITEHFKAWENIGMKLGKNMYEAKFLVEAAGGMGWFDASHISFYQKD
jgi:hypothetical protein